MEIQSKNKTCAGCNLEDDAPKRCYALWAVMRDIHENETPWECWCWHPPGTVYIADEKEGEC